MLDSLGYSTWSAQSHSHPEQEWQDCPEHERCGLVSHEDVPTGVDN